MDCLFLCLANSYKYGGRCLAGIELEQKIESFHIVRKADGSPKWVRPVLPEGTGEIPTEMTQDIDIFDIVKAEGIDACPHYSHNEDVTFTSLSKIRKYPRSPQIVSRLCDNVHGMLLGSPEKRLSEEQYQQGDCSLALIKPEHIVITCTEVEELAKFRVKFTYHDHEYDCSLTDPTYLRALQSYGIESLERNEGEMYLVVSLSKEYQGFYHKLVAGVIDMTEDIFQAAKLVPAEQLVSSPQQALKQYFGYDSFRPLQEEIIEHIMSDKDCLVLMPTGGGKSVCYQIPALLREGLTIVVSPLLSLMKDQVETLRANGVPATALNSTMDRGEDYETRRQLQSGQIKLLYISPERLLTEAKGLLRHLKVSLLAIDEAHCISQWGHDFRPEYAQIGEVRDVYSGVPFAAFTATADKVTRNDIIKQLRLDHPRTFISSFDRPNISLNVRIGLTSNDKFRAVLALIERHPGESGIIYCLARHTTEELAERLKAKGVKAAAYHASLSNIERNTVQENFQNDRIDVVCATVAFGMGIDKGNVRFVAHYNLPKNIESYYQEIGRGGRDGLPCETILFYNIGDLSTLRRFCESSTQRDVLLDKLERMQQFAEAQVCRRRILLNYFSESMDHDCCNCDICQAPPKSFDGTEMTQKALSAIARAKQQIGLKTTIEILRGQNTAEIRKHRYDELKTFGVGRNVSTRDWTSYLTQMFQLGYYEVEPTESNHLKITDLGWDVLHNQQTVKLAMLSYEDFSVKGQKKKKREEAEAAHAAASAREVEQNLLKERLRTIRKLQAEQEGKQPTTIFSDLTLLKLVEYRPTTVCELSGMSGFSRTKILKYGLLVITAIRNHRNLPTLPDGQWDALPEELRPQARNHITCQGIRYDIKPDLFAVFPWSQCFKQLSRTCYWCLWGEVRLPLTDFVPVDIEMRAEVMEQFIQIAQQSLGIRIEDQTLILPLRTEFDEDGNPVKTLDCQSFEDGFQQLIQYIEREHHFPYRRTSAYECSLLRWYHEVSRGIRPLSVSQQEALEALNEQYKDLPRYLAKK